MMTYTYEPLESIIHLRASGVLIPSDPINYFKAIDEDPLFRPKAKELIYFTELEDITFNFRETLAIKEAFIKYNHADKISEGIFIVDSDVSKGMANLVISVFSDAYSNFQIKSLHEYVSNRFLI